MSIGEPPLEFAPMGDGLCSRKCPQKPRLTLPKGGSRWESVSAHAPRLGLLATDREAEELVVYADGARREYAAGLRIAVRGRIAIIAVTIRVRIAAKRDR